MLEEAKEPLYERDLTCVPANMYPKLPPLPSMWPILYVSDQVPTFIFKKSELSRVIIKPSEPEPEEPMVNRRRYGQKWASDCPHTNRKHYSKGLCRYCYNVNGRPDKYQRCARHADRKVYCKGLCVSCYISMRKKVVKQNKKQGGQIKTDQWYYFANYFILYSNKIIRYNINHFSSILL